MRSILDHKYHYGGAVVARLAVICATSIWGMVVVLNDNALRVTPYGALVASVVHENIVGYFMLALCLWAIIWLMIQHPPRWYGLIPYGFFSVGWGFVCMTNWYPVFTGGTIFPTALGWTTTGAALAAYAFMANPKKNTNGTWT